MHIIEHDNKSNITDHTNQLNIQGTTNTFTLTTHCLSPQKHIISHRGCWQPTTLNNLTMNQENPSDGQFGLGMLE